MTYTATGPDGEFLLPAPVSVRLDRDEDAPADGFTGVFPLPDGFGEITGLVVRDAGGEVCFDGIVDEREQSLGNGALLTLVARSRAALLLDNEALPQNYENPSLGTIFERHVRPYGFTGFTGDGRTFSGTLNVAKGMSEWAAAAAFCSAFLKVKPRVSGGVFDAAGSAPERELRFGPGGIAVSSAVLRSRYSGLLSEVYVLSPGGGTYSLAARDPDTRALGIRRRRFLSSGASDAGAVLGAARRGSAAAVLDCPGEVTAPLLSPAGVSPGIPAPEGPLVVSAVRYLLDAGGEHSRITLRRKE